MLQGPGGRSLFQFGCSMRGGFLYLPLEVLVSFSPEMLSRHGAEWSGSGLNGAGRAGVGGASGVFVESRLHFCCGPEASAEWFETQAQEMFGGSRLVGR